MKPSIRNVKKTRKPRAAKVKSDPVNETERLASFAASLVQAPAPCACPEENNSKLILAALRGIEESLVKLTEAVVAFAARPVAEKAPRAPRAAKEEFEARQVDKVANPPLIVGKTPVCAHARTEPSPGNAKLLRCLDCSYVFDAPAEAVKPVDFESMRAAAIKFGTEKGKPALLAVMAKYIPAGAEQKLASIPEAKRAAFVEEVSA